MSKYYCMPPNMVMILRDLANDEISKLGELDYSCEQEGQDIDNSIAILSDFLDLTEE